MLQKTPGPNIRARTSIPPPSVTFGQLVGLFDAQYVGPMLKPGTTVSHRLALEELRRAHGALKATALTRAHVVALHFDMADRPYAANRAAAVWSKAFAWAANAGLVPEDTTQQKASRSITSRAVSAF